MILAELDQSQPNSSPWIAMGVKPMKGLLKSLRYISHIFEVDKEEEFQIGFPTDVKHVAHIGQDGPSANAPSWMSEFKNSPEDLSVVTNAVIVISKNHTTNLSKKDVMANVCGQLPPIHSSAGKNSDSTKKSRSCPPLSSSVDSPGRKERDSLGGKPQTLRRSRNSGQGSGLISSSGVPLNKDSSAMIESADDCTRSSRRSRRPDPISEDIAEESPRKKVTSGGNYRSCRRSRKSGPDPVSEDTAGEFLSRKPGGNTRSSRRTKKSGASEESRRRRKGSSGDGSVKSKGGSSVERSVRSKAKKDEELGLESGLRNTNLEMCEEEEGY